MVLGYETINFSVNNNYYDKMHAVKLEGCILNVYKRVGLTIMIAT